jgi:AcrR family transcriptional regulator
MKKAALPLRRQTPRARAASTRAVRTGGRSARVVDDVLRATLAEIDRVGYVALRIEDVAARSGVNKTTIYRRWPTKPELVGAAVLAVKGMTAIEDTGNLESDFTKSFVDSLCHAEASEGRGLLRMVQLEGEHPEVNVLVRELREVSAEVRRVRLRAAIKRGELPRGADIELVQAVLSSAVFGPLLRLGDRVPPDQVARIVALVLAGARALKNTHR